MNFTDLIGIDYLFIKIVLVDILNGTQRDNVHHTLKRMMVVDAAVKCGVVEPSNYTISNGVIPKYNMETVNEAVEEVSSFFMTEEIMGS